MSFKNSLIFILIVCLKLGLFANHSKDINSFIKECKSGKSEAFDILPTTLVL